MSIDVAREGAIATVTVNRPDRLNALDVAALRDLLATFRDLGRDRSVRAVIFTGAGDRAFIAGADIKAMAEFTSAEAHQFGRLGHGVASAIENLPQPVICAVNGFALGGGCELALAADIRIASENAVFAQPEVKLGIPPGWGGSQRLPRVVSPGYAAQMILTGDRIDAHEALRVGLVNAVWPQADLMGKARELAASIASNSPHAVRAAKRLMHPGHRSNPISGLSEEAKAFSIAFEHPDRLSGMTAFLEKRSPAFED